MKLSASLKELWYQMKQPPFSERLLEPGLFWLVLLGGLLMVTSFVLRDGRLKQIALVVIAIGGFLIWPYLSVRKKFTDRPGGRAAPAAAVTRVRQDTAWVYYTLGAMAVGGLAFGNRGRFGYVLCVGTMVGALGVSVFSLWLDAQDAGVLRVDSRRPPPLR